MEEIIKNNKWPNKAMNADLGALSSFSLAQKSRQHTQTGYAGIKCPRTGVTECHFLLKRLYERAW